MQIPIITAIITTAGSALTAVLTIYLKNYIETKGDKTIIYSRRKSLKGFWKGSFNQEDITYPIEMEIEANNKKVFGEGKSFPNNTVNKFSFTGAFKNDRF